MAFPVSARSTGALVTSSIWNADLKDNLNALQAGTVAITKTTLDGTASDPAVSAAGDAVIAYNTTSNEVRVSKNGGVFEQLGANGTDGNLILAMRFFN